MRTLRLLFPLAFVITCFYACQSGSSVEAVEYTLELPSEPYDYLSVNEEVKDFILPKELTTDSDTPITTGNNSLVLNGSTTGLKVTSDELATLGRVLFYDRNLSKNNSIACASCHKQEFAFADGEQRSQGFGGQETKRNSISITNPVAKNNFFWDGRAGSLNQLALEPVFNHIEMGIDSPQELVAKVRAQDYYEDLFEDAFGSKEIELRQIEEAIAQFVGSVFKADSRFDEGLEVNFSNFSQLEKHGMALFFSEKTNCASCHNGVNFASPTAARNNPYVSTLGTTNIGLQMEYDDPGFINGKFTIPSLRNVALTAPYMHDGRFNTLREVLDHYNTGVVNHPDLDIKLKRNNQPVRMELTELDMQALEAFMLTLTSKTITTDERYSNPFRT